MNLASEFRVKVYLYSSEAITTTLIAQSALQTLKSL